VDLVHRGDLIIACNLGTQPVTVPVTGEEVLAWGTPEVDSETTVLDGRSFAILRMAPAAEPALPSAPRA
jgi:maltooligosyltrehalose trehalohydrolase